MPKKVDANQAEIVKALRKVGATVQSLAAVGDGVPDLAVGYAARTYLLEIKDGKKAPSQRRLRPAQQDWHNAWMGHVAVVESIDDALRVIGAKAEKAASV